MPVSTGAGRSVSSTRCPPCRPTPTARVIDLSVRWASMGPILVGMTSALDRCRQKRREQAGARSPGAVGCQYGEHLRTQIGRRSSFGRRQSACLRRNAGISISSIPLLASASTFAAALRPLRHTLGVVSAL